MKKESQPTHRRFLSLSFLLVAALSVVCTRVTSAWHTTQSVRRLSIPHSPPPCDQAMAYGNHTRYVVRLTKGVRYDIWNSRDDWYARESSWHHKKQGVRSTRSVHVFRKLQRGLQSSPTAVACPSTRGVIRVQACKHRSLEYAEYRVKLSHLIHGGDMVSVPGVASLRVPHEPLH